MEGVAVDKNQFEMLFRTRFTELLLDTGNALYRPKYY
jgi:hypothetical protein